MLIIPIDPVPAPCRLRIYDVDVSGDDGSEDGVSDSDVSDDGYGFRLRSSSERAPLSSLPRGGAALRGLEGPETFRRC